MRSQLVLVGSNSHNNNYSDGVGKSRPRHSSVLAQALVSPTLTGRPSPTRYSRLSNEMSEFQSLRTTDLMSSSKKLSQNSAESLLGKVRLTESGPTTILRFMELLRPLQSSMTSLRESGSATDDEEDEDEADALFRQHERDRSRILRICCSLDNLLLAIADTVRENKLDVMAIVCGPAQEFVQLTRNGMRQIAAAMMTTLPNGDNANPDSLPSLTAKEEGHLRDFLVEIADRWSALDELLRTFYVSTLQTVQDELAQLKTEYSSLQVEKQTLELEVIDMREFASNQNAASIAVSSNFMRLADQQDRPNRPETEEGDAIQGADNVPGYSLKDQIEEAGERRTDAEEIEMLKRQCEEYGRLLEMAKQEIRLSHQERQSQHARLIELSQSLLRDQEVSQLRSELQSEKKRVKLLEIESLRLRETEIDLNAKIQSLQLNQPPASVAKGGIRGNGPSTQQSRAGSLVLRPEDVTNILNETTQGSIIEQRLELIQDALPSTLSLGSTPHLVAFQSSRGTPWIFRMVSFSEYDIEEDDGLIRRFLADLLMTDQELETAKAQTKLRKRANVPTTGRPPSASLSSQGSSTKKRRIKQGNPVDPISVSISVEEWVQDVCVVTSVRQLMWVLYEQYLMAEEARQIDPQLCGRSKWYRESSPPLSAFVLHYFLERHATEADALRSLRRFVVVLTKLRGEYGDIQLFCEFLEGLRGQEELHFLLWVLQAVSTVELGVDYEADSEFAVKRDRHASYVCTLKALYLTRMIYQLMHVKSLKKPGSNKTVIVSKQSKPSQTSSADRTSNLPSSPSKKRRKSRTISASALSSVGTPSFVGPPGEELAKKALIDRARMEYADAVATNSGFPLTLECFNDLLLSYAESPSDDELLNLLGPFYQPSGDERKVALDIFLVLLMEMFTTQLQWRKTQLRALFVRLAKEEEVAILVAAKQRKEQEVAAAGAAAKIGRARSVVDESKVKKAKTPGPKKRSRRAGLDGSADRYLRGLNRDRLRMFLMQGGLIRSITDQDLDSLYVMLLETFNVTPSEIHFNQVYERFLQVEFFGNADFAVDFSAWELRDQPVNEETQPNLRKYIVDEWQRMSSWILGLTENDPNVYLRKTGRLLCERVMNTAVKNPTPCLRSCESVIDTVDAVRRVLGFVWRVASRRACASGARSNQFDWCLTEFYFLNQAVKVIASADEHYASSFEKGISSTESGRLPNKFDDRIVRELIESVDAIKATTGWGTAELDRLQGVLLRYSMWIAHLFECYCSAQLVTGVRGLEKDRWMTMGQDLRIIDRQLLPAATCERLFVDTAALQLPDTAKGQTQAGREEYANISCRSNAMSYDHVVDRHRFVVLLVQTALMKLSANIRKKQRCAGSIQKKELVQWTASQTMERFCREFVVQGVLNHPKRHLQHDIHRKLKNPLVAKVLLENRPFLRTIFFSYAKKQTVNSGNIVDGDEKATPDDNGIPKKLKNKHNSLTLVQFVNFLQDYRLFELDGNQVHPATAGTEGVALQLDAHETAYLFRAVMSIESDDYKRMEFDEFTAALAAIAAMKNTNPFLQRHAKIESFINELRNRAQREVITG